MTIALNKRGITLTDINEFNPKASIILSGRSRLYWYDGCYEKNQCQYNTEPIQFPCLRIPYHSLNLTSDEANTVCFYHIIDNDYVFKNADGTLYYPDYPTKAFRKIIAAHKDLPQGITFHGLRSSCVSILVHQGFDVKSIQKWVGHADINTTLKIYAKVKDKEAKKEILKGMDELLKPKSYK